MKLSQRPYLYNGKIFEVETSLTFINGPSVLTMQIRNDLNPLQKNTVENVTEKLGEEGKNKVQT